MLILATGGTFDKDYALDGNLGFHGSVLPKLIGQARLTCAHELNILMQKDSLDMTITDRRAILEACRTTASTQIIIIHGTDTMSETATFLQQANLEKTIILTGAMRPFSFGHSDAAFNFGFALALAQTAAIGVYIAMQGECFAAGKVAKNKDRAQFIHLGKD
jgi:L-asparaginase